VPAGVHLRGAPIVLLGCFKNEHPLALVTASYTHGGYWGRWNKRRKEQQRGAPNVQLSSFDFSRTHVRAKEIRTHQTFACQSTFLGVAQGRKGPVHASKCNSST